MPEKKVETPNTPVNTLDGLQDEWLKFVADWDERYQKSRQQYVFSIEDRNRYAIRQYVGKSWLYRLVHFPPTPVEPDPSPRPEPTFEAFMQWRVGDDSFIDRLWSWRYE